MWTLQCSLAALAALAVLPTTQQQQSTRTIRPQDLDRILSNERLLSSFVNCALDKTPCSQDGRELRKSIPQALSTGCASCSANQKVLTERVIRHLRAKRPRDWARLTAKYDPTGEYERRFSTSPRTTATSTPTATSPRTTATSTPKATSPTTTPGHTKTPRSAPKPTASTGARGKSTTAASAAPMASPTTATP